MPKMEELLRLVNEASHWTARIQALAVKMGTPHEHTLATKIGSGSGQQHLKFSKEDIQETVRIECSGEAFFLDADFAAKVSMFTKSKSSLA